MSVEVDIPVTYSAYLIYFSQHPLLTILPLGTVLSSIMMPALTVRLGARRQPNVSNEETLGKVSGIYEAAEAD